jgi:hypothetical protein
VWVVMPCRRDWAEWRSARVTHPSPRFVAVRFMLDPNLSARSRTYLIYITGIADDKRSG